MFPRKMYGLVEKWAPVFKPWDPLETQNHRTLEKCPVTCKIQKLNTPRN